MMKKIEDLTFLDDYMFGAVMHNPELCKKIIEKILHIPVGHLEYPELQKQLKPYYESKGVRLDVYVRDSDKVIDLELQTTKPSDIAKRTRYYQALVDIDCLMQGNHYDELPESYVVFFCLNDWIGTGLPVNTFKSICEEDRKMILNDKCTKIFLNADAWDKADDVEIKAFLKYLKTRIPTDSLSQEIDTTVEQQKLSEMFRNSYLAMNLHDYDLIQKTREETQLETQKTTAKALLAENLPIETIAKCCNLPVETILELQKEMRDGDSCGEIKN